jgi:hypothetical protein
MTTSPPETFFQACIAPERRVTSHAGGKFWAPGGNTTTTISLGVTGAGPITGKYRTGHVYLDYDAGVQNMRHAGRLAVRVRYIAVEGAVRHADRMVCGARVRAIYCFSLRALALYFSGVPRCMLASIDPGLVAAVVIG